MTTHLRLFVVCGVLAVASVLTAAFQQQSPLFTTRAELVVLHVVVKDRHGRYVSGLPREAFAVVEDGKPQEISFFSAEDAPVTVGLLIDASGSMRSNRDLVLAAAADFVENSNPRDEVFALVFNDEIRSALPPDKPFTNDAQVLRSALAGAISARGRTALYDAITAGQEYLSRGRFERKALVVVSDGGDNASATPFQEIFDRLEASNVVIHTVGLVDPYELESDPKKLERLAKASGGVSFLPHDVHEVADVVKKVAVDIRSAYTLGYVPATASAPDRLRRLHVVVRLPDGGKTVVRTRGGYIAEPRANHARVH
jgi:VWFA-related protein